VITRGKSHPSSDSLDGRKPRAEHRLNFPWSEKRVLDLDSPVIAAIT
jgi:hypothetical protein